mmetsp:Transcript_7855/g.20108  ORF Transcript_7855/g.20108 Transcript_7855/m.20108 type:complete len:148 (-) Transcript_7855:474-917(-)
MYIPAERLNDAGVQEPVDCFASFRCARGRTCARALASQARAPPYESRLLTSCCTRCGPRAVLRCARTLRRPLDPSSSEEAIDQYIQEHIRSLEERVRGSLLSAAANSRERERAAVGRELLPPEKRQKAGSMAVARRPPLHHQRSSHL